MRLKRKVRVTRSICRACLFTIPVLPKLTVDTALPWTVQYQRHLETTLADAQCPLYHVGDLTQALAHCRTVIAPSYWRLHRVTPKTVLGEVRRRCPIDDSTVDSVLASVSFHGFVFTFAAASCLGLRTLEIMHNEEVVSFIGFHVHSRLSSPRGSTHTPSHDTLRQACEMPERHLRPKTL